MLCRWLGRLLFAAMLLVIVPHTGAVQIYAPGDVDATVLNPTLEGTYRAALRTPPDNAKAHIGIFVMHTWGGSTDKPGVYGPCPAGLHHAVRRHRIHGPQGRLSGLRRSCSGDCRRDFLFAGSRGRHHAGRSSWTEHGRTHDGVLSKRAGKRHRRVSLLRTHPSL